MPLDENDLAEPPLDQDLGPDVDAIIAERDEYRDRFMRAMFDEKGVKCVVQYIPLDRYEYYRRQGMGEACCPNADMFFDSMISFPFQHWLSEEEFDYMLASTREVLASLR